MNTIHRKPSGTHDIARARRKHPLGAAALLALGFGWNAGPGCRVSASNLAPLTVK